MGIPNNLGASMKNRSQQSGQAIVEAVLILSLIVMVSAYVFNELQSRQILSKMIVSPWEKMNLMIEYGDWNNPIHPNSQKKILTFDSEESG